MNFLYPTGSKSNDCAKFTKKSSKKRIISTYNWLENTCKMNNNVVLI